MVTVPHRGRKPCLPRRTQRRLGHPSRRVGDVNLDDRERIGCRVGYATTPGMQATICSSFLVDAHGWLRTFGRVLQLKPRIVDNDHVSRFRPIVSLGLGFLLLSATPSFADEASPSSTGEVGSYLTNPYQDDPTDWNDPWRDNIVGPRNELSTIDGHIGSGVRATIDQGEHFGAAMRWRFADNNFEDPEQLWFRYYLRFPEGFPNTGKGKIPGPAGLYSASARGNQPSTPASPGWSARMFFAPGDQGVDHTRIGFYLYHLDQTANHGDLLLWDEEVATLEHGRWYCVEGYVALNTPGVADGLLTGWVDGTEAFSQNGIRYRRADEPAVAIESFWFDVYYGGQDPAPQRHEVDFDSLSFGQDRLGCDDSAERGFDGGFFDDEGSVHESAIDELRTAGVIHGCNANGDAFCPDAGVTRGEMAKLIVRALQLPPSELDHFTDDDGSPFESAINILASLGVTNGCGEAIFCPDRVMSRAEVAAFINRALALPKAQTDHFADDAASLFQTDINALAEAGITYGCGASVFCPDAEASRSEAATFVVRAMRVWEMNAIPADTPEPIIMVHLFRPRAI